MLVLVLNPHCLCLLSSLFVACETSCQATQRQSAAWAPYGRRGFQLHGILIFALAEERWAPEKASRQPEKD